MRLSVFLAVLVWTLDKFFVPDHVAAVLDDLDTRWTVERGQPAVN